LESAQILKFLMTLTNPAPEVVASIESGLTWLEAAKITGLAKTRGAGKTTYESNPASAEIYWARFYDLASGKPVFPGRDGVLYDSFNAMAAQNRLGYDYLSTLPGSIVTNGQKKWRKMLAER
jgi:PelA/Pel-15E family pectate lyase